MAACDVDQGQAAVALNADSVVLKERLVDTLKKYLAADFNVQECEEEIDVPETAHAIDCIGVMGDFVPPEGIPMEIARHEGPPFFARFMAMSMETDLLELPELAGEFWTRWSAQEMTYAAAFAQAIRTVSEGATTVSVHCSVGLVSDVVSKLTHLGFHLKWW